MTLPASGVAILSWLIAFESISGTGRSLNSLLPESGSDGLGAGGG